MDIGITECGGIRQQAGLNIIQQVQDGRDDALLADELLTIPTRYIPTREGRIALFHIFGANFQPDRHTAHLPVIELEAGALVAVIDVDAHASFAQIIHNAHQRFHDRTALLFLAIDRDGYDLNWCQLRRQAQTLVVTVSHHNRTDHARTHAPGGRPAELQVVLFIQVLDVKRLGKVLAEVVAGAGLQRALITHHGFDGIGSQCASKTLDVALLSLDDRNRGIVDGEVGIDIEHTQRFFLSLLMGRMGCMALLPQELGRAQERPRPQLPTHNIRPLVNQQRQITIGLNPFAECFADHRFRGRTHNEWLF